MPLRIPIAFPTPSLCFWCTLHFPLTKSLSLAAGSCSPAQLVPGFIDPNEESDINPCCVFSDILDSYCILSLKMFAILPLDSKSITYSIGMALNLCFHPNTGQHRAEDRGWGFDQKKKKNQTPVCHWSSLNRALWLWAVNPFTCLCILLVVPRMIKMMSWNVLGDLVVKNPPYKAGTQVWSLVREIRSHMPRSNQIRMTQLVKHECHNYRVSALQQTAQRASAKTGRNKINKRMIKKKATMKNLLAVKSRPIRLPMFA